MTQDPETELRATLIAILLGAAGAQAAPTLLAHRGLAQGFDRTGLDNRTCTAGRMLPPSHGYIENTLPSMEAAFAYGADVVEFDVHPTADGEFVVFHDWTLECRTDGHGVTRGQTLAYLKALDVGHGYTADRGATFPFRGRFVGAMPTWAEVMRRFPGRRFFVNVKGNTRAEGERIVDYIAHHSMDTGLLLFVGGDNPLQVVREQLPGVRTLSKPRLEACGLRYLLLGWTGHVPEACRDSVIFVPVNLQWLAWGWPDRFVERMARVNAEVFVIGPVTFETRTAGTTSIDDLEALARIPGEYSGGISTDRIDLIGPAMKRR